MNRKSADEAVDKTSELPDDVLADIISRLTLQEAIATSILSTRWRHLYTYITRLTFVTRGPLKQPKDRYLERLPEKGFLGRIKEIDRILDSNKGSRVLEEFSVLRLERERNVESLDIGMVYNTKAMPDNHTFPLGTSIKKDREGLGSFLGLKSLKQLSLRSLHVDDQHVELLVSNFTVLEHLLIIGSHRLRKVSMFGHSKLKHLGISSSRNVVSVEVCNMISLVSLTCYQLRSKYSLLLNNVPKLVEFNSSDQVHILGRVLPGISSCILDQLLYINISTGLRPERISTPAPMLKNLKHLKLEIMGSFLEADRLSCLPLFWRCPHLEKVEIKLSLRGYHTFNYKRCRMFHLMLRSGYLVRELKYHLKEVTLSGFRGSIGEIKLGWALILKAAALERLIIKPCHETPEIRERVANVAENNFRRNIPTSAKLIII